MESSVPKESVVQLFQVIAGSLNNGLGSVLSTLTDRIVSPNVSHRSPLLGFVSGTMKLSDEVFAPAGTIVL